MFSCEFFEISKKTYFTEHTLETASINTYLKETNNEIKNKRNIYPRVLVVDIVRIHVSFNGKFKILYEQYLIYLIFMNTFLIFLYRYGRLLL